MPFKKVEYDCSVMGRNPAMVAVLGLAVLLPCSMLGQTPTVHGTPPSVTSLGFGGTGNRPHGLPPSVTSLGFGSVPTFNSNPNHHHHRGLGTGGYYFPYAYPYVVDGPPDDSYDDDSDGGPTIFDRRGHGTPSSSADSGHVTASQDQAPQPSAPVEVADATPQPSTVLVFKDGHQLEVSNYAIVGSTLYDLSRDRQWKIALSELDLPGTVKQNGDRGLDFQVPAGVQAN